MVSSCAKAHFSWFHLWLKKQTHWLLLELKKNNMCWNWIKNMQKAIWRCQCDIQYCCQINAQPSDVSWQKHMIPALASSHAPDLYKYIYTMNYEKQKQENELRKNKLVSGLEYIQDAAAWTKWMWKWQWDCCSSLCSTFKKRSEANTSPDTFNRFQSLTARLDLYVLNFHPLTESLHSSWDKSW